MPPSPPEPELAIEKINVRRVVRAGERVAFRLIVQNRGNEAARNVTACDRLPSGLVFASIANGTTRGRLQCFRVRRLRPGASATFVVYTRTARVEADSIVIVNTAWVIAAGEAASRRRVGRAPASVARVAAASPVRPARRGVSGHR